MERRRKNIYERCIKRIIDIIFSLAAIILLMPVLLVIACLVRIKLGTPILFRQNRPGLKEKVFVIYKFRTMTNGVDENGNLLPDEERLNAFGKKLRESSLDELPELFNILKGDMSIVGPRPLLVEYLPLYNERQKRRHTIRPGLTGYAQAFGRNKLTWEERFEMDVRYTEHITFRNDCRILLQTVKTVWKKEGINSDTSVTMEPFTGSGKD